MLHDVLPAARSALSCTRFSEVLRLSARRSVHAGCDLFCLNTKNSKCPLKQSRFLCMPSELAPPTPPHPPHSLNHCDSSSLSPSTPHPSSSAVAVWGHGARLLRIHHVRRGLLQEGGEGDGESADKFRDIEGKSKGEAIVMELNVWLRSCNKFWMFSQPPTYREQVTRKHCERECVCSYEYSTPMDSFASCFISMLSGLDLPKASPAPLLNHSLTTPNLTNNIHFPFSSHSLCTLGQSSTPTYTM
jgi:hypothetical protein